MQPPLMAPQEFLPPTPLSNFGPASYQPEMASPPEAPAAPAEPQPKQEESGFGGFIKGAMSAIGDLFGF
jgi:hypothetical protein